MRSPHLDPLRPSRSRPPRFRSTTIAERRSAEGDDTSTTRKSPANARWFARNSHRVRALGERAGEGELVVLEREHGLRLGTRRRAQAETPDEHVYGIPARERATRQLENERRR